MSGSQSAEVLKRQEASAEQNCPIALLHRAEWPLVMSRREVSVRVDGTTEGRHGEACSLRRCERVQRAAAFGEIVLAGALTRTDLICPVAGGTRHATAAGALRTCAPPGAPTGSVACASSQSRAKKIAGQRSARPAPARRQLRKERSE